MRGWFGGLPIRRKLVVMTAASTTAALLLAGGGFLAWDIAAYRSSIEEDVRGQLRILGESSATAIVFGDERAAGETIAALELRPHVVMACVYGADGRLFATYHRGRSGSCPPMPGAEITVAWRDARFAVPIVHSSSRVGMLFIHRDMGDVQERLLVGLGMVAVLIVLCTLVALAIGGRLQRSIVDPMLQLAGTARAVSDERHFDRRVVPASSDEVGVV
ncbi:MAG: CHASE sensor domain-containing protein, partial [Vicinamibacterales bacterium]